MKTRLLQRTASGRSIRAYVPSLALVVAASFLVVGCDGSRDYDDSTSDDDYSLYDDSSGEDDGDDGLSGYQPTSEFADAARSSSVDVSGVSDSDLADFGVALCEQLELTESVDDTANGTSDLAELVGLYLTPSDLAVLIGDAVATTCPDLQEIVSNEAGS